MSILEWLGLLGGRREVRRGEPDAVRAIVDKLDEMDESKARFVASFAFVLSRVASADREVSAEETRSMETLVARHGELSAEEAMIVVQMAKQQQLWFGGTEDFLVTRELERLASERQKLELVECMFAVSAADDTILAVEDGVIGQIANQLRIDRRDYAAIRNKFRDRLAVLRDPEESDEEGA